VRRFLCFVSFSPFGKRNEVPPRTVANSAKKIGWHGLREDLKSSNPAKTNTTIQRLKCWLGTA